MRLPGRVDHLQTVAAIAATGAGVAVFLNRGDQIAQHQPLQQEPFLGLVAHSAGLIAVLLDQVHSLPGPVGRHVLPPVYEHRCRYALAHCDPPLGADQVDAIGPVIGLRLPDKIHLCVYAALKAKSGAAALAQHQSGVAVRGMYLLRVLYIADARLAPVGLQQMRVRPFDIATVQPHPVVEMGPISISELPAQRPPLSPARSCTN